ncbi:unnamed protein product [Brassica napus]|uniref:(rape) hypothetical protein n=1 Tax=Brassica napus TaxID=3708 RepID=A0A816UIZ2_BRANA|nr:unnamed protein product [Brassica napus]
MRNPSFWKWLLSRWFGSGGGVLVLMMKLSAEVKSVKSTIRWFSSRV